MDIAEKALSTGDVIVDVRAHEKGTPFQDTPVREPSLTRAFLKIQEGCDDYCTYCIVPYARGPSRSRPLDAVLEEARYLVEKGYKEIVLTGTHIGLYGLDLRPGGAEHRVPDEVRIGAGVSAHSSPEPIHGALHSAVTGVSQKTDLPLVVRLLSEIQGLSRLRISSLEPHDVTPELIHCLRYPQVCHHLHLPLQSGSERVLKKMGRRYDAKAFLDIVESVRKVAPDIGLSADIIVGFPGEDEVDFQHTLEIIRTAGISRLHVFKYSPRPGTPALSLIHISVVLLWHTCPQRGRQSVERPA